MNAIALRRLLALVFATALLLGCSRDTEESLIASARGYLDKNDVVAATIQLKSALQKNPDSASARALLGKALLAGGDAASALVELDKAKALGVPEEQLAPERARALLLTGGAAKVVEQYAGTTLPEPRAQADLLSSLAAAYAARNDLPKAGETVERALQLQPKFAPAVLLQARLKAAQKDVDGALAALDQLLAQEPDHEAAGLLRAELMLVGRNDPAAALEGLRKVLAAHPKSVSAHVATTRLLRQMGKADEARTQLAELKKVAPKHPDTLLLEAQQQAQDGNAQGARETAMQLLKVAPENPRVLFVAGLAEYQLNSFVQAEAHLAKAVKVAPGFVGARQLLAQTYLRTGQPAKAIEALMPITDGASADGVSLALAGEAHLALGDTARADDAFKRAAAAAPDDLRVRTSVALGQLAQGQPSAMEALEAIAAADAGTRADLALVTARLRANDPNGALKAVDRLQKKTPDRPLPDLLRGRILQARNDPGGAAAAFEAALKKDPKYFPAVAGLASLDVAQGKPDQARQRFEALIASDPANYQAQIALAELAGRTGAPPEEVTQRLNAAVKANPTQAQPRLLLIDQLLRHGEAKAALAAAQDAAAALPNNPAVQEALGRAQLASGDTQQAISTLGRLANQQPTNPMAQLRLADAYVTVRDYDNARRSLEKALQIQADFVPAKRGLALVAVAQGRVPDALAIAREMQKAQPKQPGGFALEGDIQAHQKNWPAAIAAQRVALSLARNAESAIRLHQTYLAAGQPAEADRLAGEWRRDHPNDAAFRFYLGDAATARKDWAAAEANYLAVAQMQPRNALALNNAAWAMVQQGKPGAVKVAEQANQILPGRAQLLDTLATALAAEGQLPKAIETQKQALARSPQDPNLRLALARLYIKSGDKPQARTELEQLAQLGDKFAAQAEVAELLKGLR